VYLPGSAFQRRPLLETSTTRSPGRYTLLHVPALPAGSTGFKHCSIAAIKAQEGTDRFDRSKLLRLIDELNDNYARANGYAVHALLRAILDHIPPLLGSADFEAAVNNYRWSRTDRVYMRRLLDFKLQADDVLHRQISGKADLLSLEDVPPRAWVNRLLQECAS
jgi:hypothetical protein